MAIVKVATCLYEQRLRSKYVPICIAVTQLHVQSEQGARMPLPVDRRASANITPKPWTGGSGLLEPATLLLAQDTTGVDVKAGVASPAVCTVVVGAISLARLMI